MGSEDDKLEQDLSERLELKDQSGEIIPFDEGDHELFERLYRRHIGFIK